MGLLRTSGQFDEELFLLPFPELMMRLLDKEEADFGSGLISEAEDSSRCLLWNEDGDAFAVLVAQFTERVLKRHFRRTKFDSFVRKLHRWGFRRDRNQRTEAAFPPGAVAFRSPFFKKGDYELLKKIKANHGKRAGTCSESGETADKGRPRGKRPRVEDSSIAYHVQGSNFASHEELSGLQLLNQQQTRTRFLSFHTPPGFSIPFQSLVPLQGALLNQNREGIPFQPGLSTSAPTDGTGTYLESLLQQRTPGGNIGASSPAVGDLGTPAGYRPSPALLASTFPPSKTPFRRFSNNPPAETVPNPLKTATIDDRMGTTGGDVKELLAQTLPTSR